MRLVHDRVGRHEPPGLSLRPPKQARRVRVIRVLRHQHGEEPAGIDEDACYFGSSGPAYTSARCLPLELDTSVCSE